MVIMDMIVRLLTSNRAVFTCQLSVFIGLVVYKIPPVAWSLRGHLWGWRVVLDHFSLHQFWEHFFEIFLFVEVGQGFCGFGYPQELA